MWISKKKWNEMRDRLNKHDKSINELIDCHKVNWTPYITYEFGHEEIRLFQNGLTHNTITISTDTIPNVTLEELTKLVIDGTPIERKENVEMTSKFYRR